MLRALEQDVECVRDNYAENVDDSVLFSELAARENLVFVSTDKGQTTRKEEARALKQAGVTALYFAPFFQKMLLWDQAVWIVTRWPKIKGFAEATTKGTCAEIKRNGTALVFQL
jgi:hypothetical protein